MGDSGASRCHKHYPGEEVFKIAPRKVAWQSSWSVWRTLPRLGKSQDEEKVIKAARGIMKRARACRAVGGTTFEYKLDKFLKSFEESKE